MASMDPVTIPSLSAEQEELFRLIEDTREHVFVTGRAGTGKSTLLQHVAWNTEKQIAVCAPTGVAALNVEGQTIHSLFRLPIGLIADSELEQSEPARRRTRTTGSGPGCSAAHHRAAARERAGTGRRT